MPLSSYLGLRDSSGGKEATCNARDPGSIPESGRSSGEGIGYPLQYSGLEFLGFPGSSGGKEAACNVGDLVRSLDWEDPLGKGKTTH